MDSLRGIPVEHKLETFSMPSTGTSSSHPQKLTMSIRAPLRSRHTKLHVDFKYFPHTSNNTLPSQHFAKPFRLKHSTSLNTTSLAAPRTNRLKAANKELSSLCVVKAEFRNSFVCLKTIVISSTSL